MTRQGKIAVLLLAAAVAGAAVGVVLRQEMGARGGRQQVASVGVPAIGGPFSLTNQRGERVSDADFRGRLMLIYFGYTFGPDVCPVALQDMSFALDALGESAAQVQPLFITVDPARDTPEVLAEYAALFHPRLVALTGTAEEIAAVAEAYGVSYGKAENPDPEAEGDLVNHLARFYLMDRDGTYLRQFAVDSGWEALAEGIRQHL